MAFDASQRSGQRRPLTPLTYIKGEVQKQFFVQCYLPKQKPKAYTINRGLGNFRCHSKTDCPNPIVVLLWNFQSGSFLKQDAPTKLKHTTTYEIVNKLSAKLRLLLHAKKEV